MENEVKCQNCGSIDVEEGYELNLCETCRDNLSKRPLPLKIKLVMIATIILTIISLLSFKTTIKYGIEYEKGLKAERSHKYVTAMKCYENVLKKYPDAKDVKIKLYLAYYQNGLIDDACSVLDQLAKVKTNKRTANEVNSITNKIDHYYAPSKGLTKILKEKENLNGEELLQTIQPLVSKNPYNVWDNYILANAYFESQKYTEANKIMSKILAKNRDFYYGYVLQAATFRELGQYDNAIFSANKILENNIEDTNAYVALSKIELKRKNNKKGLDYALKAYNLDTESSYIVANLSLAYHYNNDIKNRDKFFNIFKKVTPNDKYTLNLLESIYNNKIQWQN